MEQLGDIAKTVGAALATTRARLLQIGAKVAPMADVRPDAANVRAVIDDALHEALEPIAPEAFDFLGLADAPA